MGENTGPISPVDAATRLEALLEATDAGLAGQDWNEIADQLRSVPVSLVFKIAHNSAASQLREAAAKVFAERYGELDRAVTATPKPKPTVPVIIKTVQRRSTRRPPKR